MMTFLSSRRWGTSGRKKADRSEDRPAWGSFPLDLLQGTRSLHRQRVPWPGQGGVISWHSFTFPSDETPQIEPTATPLQTAVLQDPQMDGSSALEAPSLEASAAPQSAERERNEAPKRSAGGVSAAGCVSAGVTSGAGDAPVARAAKARNDATRRVLSERTSGFGLMLFPFSAFRTSEMVRDAKKRTNREIGPPSRGFVLTALQGMGSLLQRQRAPPSGQTWPSQSWQYLNLPLAKPHTLPTS